MQKHNIGRRLRAVFTEDLFLKAISLLTAVVIWTIVSGERDTEWAFLVPLETKGVPADMIVTNNVPDFLDVRVQGAKSFMMEIKPQDMKVVLDLSALKLGSNFFPITPNQIRVPRGAKVTRIYPSYLTLEVDRLIRKNVGITAETEGKPPKDFFVESVDVVPSAMDIEGAEGEIKGIKALKTKSVDISGVKEDLRKEVAVDTFGRKLTLSRKEPVAVVVKIREFTSKVELKGVKVDVRNSSLTSSTSSNVNLLLEVPKSLVEDVKKGDVVHAAVDAVGLGEGRHTLNVEVVAPEVVKVLSLSPKEIKLRLSKKKDE